jgi:hypothetical protein
MLEMHPNCQCCDRDLAADALDVLICSFECTYCRTCAQRFEGAVCPNCGGALSLRPPRARSLWGTNPPSVVRVVHPENCFAAMRP